MTGIREGYDPEIRPYPVFSGPAIEDFKVFINSNDPPAQSGIADAVWNDKRGPEIHLRDKTVDFLKFIPQIPELSRSRKIFLQQHLLRCSNALVKMQLKAMYTLRFLPLLYLFFMGCDQPDLDKRSGPCPAVSGVSDDTTGTPTYKTVRGALLGTRFSSFEALQSVIRIEYGNGAITTDSTAPENTIVRVRHCSSGREVVSILEKGIHEGDFLKAFNARRSGEHWKNLYLLFRCPYAVMNRDKLEKVHALSRWKPEWFGEGDLAFFDLAKSSAGRINTPDLAFRNPQDSTEKGYLNSFNHITAQAFITTCFSEELADFVADTHERYRHPELITGRFTKEQLADLAEGPVDNYVDIINNEWGQELGKQLKEKYKIDGRTNWTPELLANYLNDLLSYYSWAFQIGFEPYDPEDEEVRRFSDKLDAVMKGPLPPKK